MLVETVTNLYEVSYAQRAYRLVEHDPQTNSRMLGAWVPYDRISPVQAGEPLRIFVAIEEAGRSLHYRVVTTDPVTKVLAA
jgi:hypothetical protein